MDYEYYKLLSEEDKEEWDYKYATDIKLYNYLYDNIKMALIICFAPFLLLINVGMAIKDYINYEEYLINCINIFNVSFKIGIFYLGFMLIFELIFLISNSYKKNNWLKRKGYNIKFHEYELKQLKGNKKNV